MRWLDKNRRISGEVSTVVGDSNLTSRTSCLSIKRLRLISETRCIVRVIADVTFRAVTRISFHDLVVTIRILEALSGNVEGMGKCNMLFSAHACS